MAARSRIEGSDDKRMELTEHLGELRTHIIKSLWYLVIGTIIAYQFFAPFYGALYKPLEKEMKRLNKERIAKEIKNQGAETGTGDRYVMIPRAIHDPPTKEEFNRLADFVTWERDHPVATPIMSIVFKGFQEPFLVKVTISVMFGFIIVMPLVIYEFAMFVTPALTPTERRPLRLLMPLSVLLLIFGIAVAYGTMFYAMSWFLGYLDEFPQPAVLMQDPNDYIVFFVKMMAAFGIAFQLPVVLMAGAYAGFVTSKGLIKNWRWGIMIAFLGGLFTPANDPMSWVLMVVPLLILYFGSVFLVRFVERTKAKPKPA